MAKRPTHEESHKQNADRQSVEEELLKLSHAVKQSPSAIIITDAQGIIEYVNPKFVDITGFTTEEIVGTNAADLGNQTSEEEAEMWDRIRSGSVWRGEFRNKRKSGEGYWERASISAIRNQDGLITHYVKVAEDITELKEAQNALRGSQRRLFEQEKRLEMLKFANDMALKFMHELRNPLVSIGGFSERISRGKYGKDEVMEYTGIIYEQAKRLDKALNELLVQLKAAAEKA
jgi:two-component system CheB/CheR fusion protein